MCGVCESSWSGRQNAEAADTGRPDSCFPPLPLPEQHCIVAKVDELMKICDQLEALLIAAEADGHRLLEAVLYEALHPSVAATAHMTLEANE